MKLVDALLTLLRNNRDGSNPDKNSFRPRFLDNRVGPYRVLELVSLGESILFLHVVTTFFHFFLSKIALYLICRTPVFEFDPSTKT